MGRHIERQGKILRFHKLELSKRCFYLDDDDMQQIFKYSQTLYSSCIYSTIA